jgi:hypothetical protein
LGAAVAKEDASCAPKGKFMRSVWSKKGVAGTTKDLEKGVIRVFVEEFKVRRMVI